MFRALFKKLFNTTRPAKNILIAVIDDVETNRTFFQRVLVKRGYTVITANDGIAGLELVKTHKPKIVLLDFVMPGMKGPEVCKKLKADPETKDIPVLFLTSVDAPTDIIEVLRTRRGKLSY